MTLFETTFKDICRETALEARDSVSLWGKGRFVTAQSNKDHLSQQDKDGAALLVTTFKDWHFGNSVSKPGTQTRLLL